MKKIFLFAASAALILASCAKTEVVDLKGGEKGRLTIKISGGNATRAIDTVVEGDEIEGSEIGTITLSNATAYVFDGTGAYLGTEPLTPATAMGADGQQTTGTYPLSAKIYVVGNTQAALTQPTTLAGVKAATEAVATLDADFQKAPLAGESTQITSNGTLFTAAIELTPVVSRLELVAIDSKADDNGGLITAFDVTGVYVDSTYPSHTYEGLGFGTEAYQGTSTTMTGIAANYKNEGTWSSTGSPASVQISGTQIWGYNVAPSAASAPTSGKNVNRLIVRLENVIYDADGAGTSAAPAPYAGVHFLTVNNYTSGTNFERGKIYRVGSDATGAGKFEFDKDDLDPIPNPPTGNQLINVKVTVKQWVLVTPGAVLM